MRGGGQAIAGPCSRDEVALALVELERTLERTNLVLFAAIDLRENLGEIHARVRADSQLVQLIGKRNRLASEPFALGEVTPPREHLRLNLPPSDLRGGVIGGAQRFALPRPILGLLESPLGVQAPS